MGKKEVTTCDICGKQKTPEELTHAVAIAKKGGPTMEKPEVCTDCAKAVHAVIEKRGKPKEPKAPKGERKPRKQRAKKDPEAEAPAQG